jgi:SOS-response transcriptional repressor LexA
LITDRQAAVLAEITRFGAAHGIAPSIRDLCTALGLRSTNGAADHIARLATKGLVERLHVDGRPVARALVVTRRGREALELWWRARGVLS